MLGAVVIIGLVQVHGIPWFFGLYVVIWSPLCEALVVYDGFYICVCGGRTADQYKAWRLLPIVSAILLTHSLEVAERISELRERIDIRNAWKIYWQNTNLVFVTAVR